MTYLFCYGSNGPKQLEERLGYKPVLRAAYAQGYRRYFRGWSTKWQGGVATLLKEKGQTFGLVAEVDSEDLDRLDIFEGVRSGNYKRAKIDVMVADDNGNFKKKKCVVYLSKSKEFNPPTKKYLQAVLKTISTFWEVPNGVKDIPVR